MIFAPVPVEFTFFDPERIGTQLLRDSVDSEGGVVAVKSGLETIEKILNEMESTLDRLVIFIKNVLVSH